MSLSAHYVAQSHWRDDNVTAMLPGEEAPEEIRPLEDRKMAPTCSSVACDSGRVLWCGRVI